MIPCLFLGNAAADDSYQAHAEQIYGRYRTNSERHGLYEIRQAADDFVQRGNPAPGSLTKVLGPDIRIMVPACKVPLRAGWHRPASDGRDRGVDVSCSRTVDRNEPRWTVYVPVLVEKRGRGR